jgi:hypothetical protein
MAPRVLSLLEVTLQVLLGTAGAVVFAVLTARNATLLSALLGA